MRMILVLVILAACSGAGPNFPYGGAQASCGAEKVQDLLGQPFSGLRASFPDSARIIPWGAAITEDHIPGRLNVYLDEAGTIINIRCG